VGRSVVANCHIDQFSGNLAKKVAGTGFEPVTSRLFANPCSPQKLAFSPRDNAIFDTNLPFASRRTGSQVFSKNSRMPENKTVVYGLTQVKEFRRSAKDLGAV
jgi:hypothetical protein